MARLMRVPVSRELWQESVTEGWTPGVGRTIRCTKGLPEGAELVSSGYNPQRGIVHLIFHHPSFDEVPPGAPIPEMMAEYTIEDTT